MTIVSKFLDDTIDKCEELGYSKLMLSKGIVGTAILAYVIRLSYPHIENQLKYLYKCKTNEATNSNDKGQRIPNKLINNKNKNSLNNNNNNNNNNKNNNNCQNDERICDKNGIAGQPNNFNGKQNCGVDGGAVDGDGAADPDDTLLNQTDTNQNNVNQKLGHNNVKKEKLIGLNFEFLYQLKLLLKIMIPNYLCHETGLLAVHTVCLISRTFLSIYVAAMEGALVKFIVQKDVKKFTMMLLKWFTIALPATFVNSMIRYLENKLALAFRTRLVHHSYNLYFKNQTYYRVTNLDGRIENADHRLTEDIAVFSSSVAHLYSHLTKPCFDLMLIGLALMSSSKKMKANIFTGPLLSFTVILTTAHILRVVSPKFGQLVSEEANRYGYLRHIHSRIITNSEEIAFYGGHNVELLQLRNAYSRLQQQMNCIFSQKLWFIMLEQFFMKYVWSGTGMIMISLPILSSAGTVVTTTSAAPATTTITNKYDVSERTQYLTTARNLLISGADAIERLMSSYKEIVALAGYTNRVAGMLEVFKDTSNGIYRKSIVQQQLAQAQEELEENQLELLSADGSGDGVNKDEKNPLQLSTINNNNNNNNYGSNTAGILEFLNGQPIAKGKIFYTTAGTGPGTHNTIVLKNVPVVTPNCDIVVQSLTLKIEPGMHLLITGPNGCGKSSLFRIISGLWPIYGGEMHIPKSQNGKSCMFYIPQRPYLSIGSLRDQIIYPDTVNDMVAKDISEEKLHNILKMVSLEHIVTRDKFDLVRDWKDILSGGEKQRMAIARLFYHKPEYALLDECTSAISIDVESSIYEAAIASGITLLTITHRPTLWKFHTHILEFDGQGGWQFSTIEKFTKINR